MRIGSPLFRTAVPADQQEPPAPTDVELHELTPADEEAQRAGRHMESGRLRMAQRHYDIAADLYDGEGRHEAADEMREASAALTWGALNDQGVS